MSKLGDALRMSVLKRFGGEGARDRVKLRAWLEQMSDFNPTYARILEAFKDGNKERARAEVDQLIAAVNHGREQLPDFDSADLRTVTGDYATALLELARSADRVLQLDEAAAREDTTADRAEAETALAEFRGRGVDARAASQELVARLTAGLTSKQRSMIDERMREQGQPGE
jgi:hypothetical protein